MHRGGPKAAFFLCLYDSTAEEKPPMDGWQFTAEMTKALAWPLALVTVARMFKGRLEQLLDKVKHAKGAGFEFDFAEQVQDAKEKAEAVEVTSQPTAHLPIQPGSQEDRDADYFDSLLLKADEENRPSAMILDAWRNVENMIAATIRAHGLRLDRKSPTAAADRLRMHGLLTFNEYILIRQLSDLRNKVAHASDFEPDARTAMNYTTSAQKVVALLQVAYAKGRTKSDTDFSHPHDVNS